jgi:uncharacterized membrane protein
MANLVLATAAFVFGHVALSSTPVRGVLARTLGEWGFLALYSLISILCMIWMVAAWQAAPVVELWPSAPWVRGLSLAVMVPATVLVVAGYTSPNPTAVLLDRFAGDTPKGIFKVTRHPVMWGVGLWGLAHVAANGHAASLIFFGGLSALALGGTALMDRKRRGLGGARWTTLEAATSNLPFAALVAGRARVGAGEIGWWRIALGLALYLGLVSGHQWLFGASPVP